MNSSTVEQEGLLVGGLVIHEGPKNGGYWSLSESLTRIGRSDLCELCLSGAGIRHVHCVIILTPTGPLLRSVGGLTYVNEDAVKQRLLQHGDVISLGPYRIEVNWPTPPNPDPIPLGLTSPRAA
ncbi:MAG: FHA domain-containing protein [Gemmataceae bacterium]|jgi:pSer/pThr/pTyr-binding forkhead associated (FHA) protein|nr:FHA domain-containing protein [Gemmataceae bacterium]